jgi:hypothetical protein
MIRFKTDENLPVEGRTCFASTAKTPPASANKG